MNTIKPVEISVREQRAFLFLISADFWLKMKEKRLNSLKYLTNYEGYAIMIKNEKRVDLKEFFCKSKLRFTKGGIKERTELFDRLIALPKQEREAVLKAVSYYEAHNHEGRFPDWCT